MTAPWLTAALTAADVTDLDRRRLNRLASEVIRAVMDLDPQKVPAPARTAVEKLGDPKIRAMIFDHKVDDHDQVTAAIGSLAEMITGLETFKTPQDNMMFMRAMGITIDVCKEIAPDVSMSDITGPLMMPLLAGLMQSCPQYTDAIMKAMAKGFGWEEPTAEAS